VNEEPITCSYILTPDEYKTTAILARRAAPLRKKLPLWAFLIVVFIFFAETLYDLAKDSSQWNFATGFLILLLGVIVLWIFSRSLPFRPFVSLRQYRKNGMLNLHFTVEVSQQGVMVKNRLAETLVKWPFVPRVVESQAGFAVYFQNSGTYFFWIPKNGFAVSGDINRCREVLRQNAPTFSEI
jgi:hypothetical protein